MDRNDRRPHPSGRPHDRTKYGRLSIPRPPRDEPLTPRLRQRGFVEAIGFHVPMGNDYEDED